MYKKFATGLLVFVATTALANGPQGKVLLLSTYPGHEVSTSTTNLSPKLAAILSPLITGVVSQVVKAVAANLQEAAQEPQVDVF